MNTPAEKGAYNSSKTRVAPVFSKITSHPTWLRRLLSLAIEGHLEYPGVPADCGSISKVCYDSADRLKKEEPLDSLLGLLESMIREFPQEMKPSIKGDSETAQKRRRLAEKDEDTINEGLQALEESKYARKAWYVLEGPTFPDVYIETDELLVVIEGKRTEGGITRKTSWMPVRHQMLRHMDGAWERKGSRRLIGLFIVEGEEDGKLSAHWSKECRETISHDALIKSLPHRTPEERYHIAACYAGVMTWEALCHEFGIPWKNI